MDKTQFFEGLEIHSLICNRDVIMAINNFKSLQKFDEFKDTPIYLHDDGSLTDVDKSLLSNIENVIFIDRKWADSEIEQYIKNHPHCMSYRLGDSKINLWHKIKTFDYYYFSKTKRVLGLDTDLLFMRKPQDVIDLIESNTPFYFPDVQSSYSFNEPKEEVSVFKNVNTGLIYIPSEEYYNIDDLEFALTNLLKNGVNYFPSWIEQSAFAHMFFKNGSYVSLGVEKYRIPYFQSVDIGIVECLHFVSYPAVRDTYEEYLDYLKFDSGTIIFKNKFFVDYKENKIPLVVEIYEHEDFLTLKYYWGLSETNQNFLDHVFRIETTEGLIEKKFQSGKNGFFIFKTNDKHLDIQHTYQWYEETNWLNLCRVYL
jgi:hypothetical protein